ncbi:MAG: hypothetical protein OXF09_00380 [Hyphomicrobiales bacterium]|nr:hypothetical protein [Hyphomicrobiales bacterium]
MAERDKLLASIVETTADYRQGVLPPPTPGHVDRWVKQFDDSAQLQILQEMDHVLKKTYFSRNRVKKFLKYLFGVKELVGNNPCAFWKSVKFLDIQINDGASQRDMLALFDEVLKEQCGFQISDCGTASNTFIYLDDAIFSGGRVGQDIVNWTNGEAPSKATVHVIVIASHQGSYYNRKKVEGNIKSSGKDINLYWWRGIKIEDRAKYTEISDVLRPTTIPDNAEVEKYVTALKYSPRLRSAGQASSLGIFSSDARRQILEQEFLKAGVQIRQKCSGLNRYQRPLGNSVLETLGFGSLIVTFRNCPNNAPLALWAGKPWYPLFDRVTNTETSQQEGGF